MKEKILIVEDDEMVIEGISDILKNYGYEIYTASKEREVFKILEKNVLQLIILDVNLGKENGFQICKKIRCMYDTPVLFLTAYSSEMELVRGFSVGGDDYVTKPFRIQELVMRVQALIRRYNRDNRVNTWTSGEIVFERNNYQIRNTKGILNLTPLELKIVINLMDKWPGYVERNQLLYKIWDKDMNYVEENTLNVNISRLREKLGNYQGKPYIFTVRGKGYRWNIDIKK